MIRVVEVDYFAYGRPDHIAFMDTVTNRFEEIGGEQIWHSRKDLEECFAMAVVDVGGEEHCLLRLDRLLSLCPPWFYENLEER